MLRRAHRAAIPGSLKQLGPILTFTWVRTVQADLAWTAGKSLIVSVPIGKTLMRIHFGWGFYGNSSSQAALTDVSRNIQVMGVVTTVGNGTETVPNPRTASGNAAPPQKRWLYWEGRQPTIAAFDAVGGLALWRDSGAQAPVDIESQVSAAGISVGSTLNVWASWAAGTAWDASGTTELWFYASAAYK